VTEVTTVTKSQKSQQLWSAECNMPKIQHKCLFHVCFTRASWTSTCSTGWLICTYGTSTCASIPKRVFLAKVLFCCPVNESVTYGWCHYKSGWPSVIITLEGRNFWLIGHWSAKHFMRHSKVRIEKSEQKWPPVIWLRGGELLVRLMSGWSATIAAQNCPSVIQLFSANLWPSEEIKNGSWCYIPKFSDCQSLVHDDRMTGSHLHVNKTTVIRR